MVTSQFFTAQKFFFPQHLPIPIYLPRSKQAISMSFSESQGYASMSIIVCSFHHTYQGISQHHPMAYQDIVNTLRQTILHQSQEQAKNFKSELLLTAKPATRFTWFECQKCNNIMLKLQQDNIHNEIRTSATSCHFQQICSSKLLAAPEARWYRQRQFHLHHFKWSLLEGSLVLTIS